MKITEDLCISKEGAEKQSYNKEQQQRIAEASMIIAEVQRNHKMPENEKFELLTKALVLTFATSQPIGQFMTFPF